MNIKEEKVIERIIEELAEITKQGIKEMISLRLKVVELEEKLEQRKAEIELMKLKEAKKNEC